MTKRWFSFILFSVITTVSQCNAHQERNCFRPTAAINHYDNVYLIDGNKYILIDSDFNEVDSGTVADEFGQQGEIDAAFVDTEEDDVYFNSGTRYFKYSYWSMSTEGQLDNSDLNPFLANGLDAAGSLGDSNYFFKGCKYLIGGEDGEEGEMISLGLPCDVDAAWRGHDGKLYLTKEGEYWSMDEDGRVTGPEMLSKLVTLTSTEFCDQEEDLYTTKIEDEQEYEKEHRCVIIDAAIAWGGRIYLFNDDEYLAFDKRGRQVRRAPISYWKGLVPNIDAGVIWSGNHGTYFFKDAKYYRYTKKGTLGPRDNKLWGSRFTHGIDAAGNFNGKTYFFQGCDILRYPGPSARVDHVIQAADVNLPCNVDAAFSSGRNLFAVKFDQIWVLHGRHWRAKGPRDLTSVLKVRSWNVCPHQ